MLRWDQCSVEVREFTAQFRTFAMETPITIQTLTDHPVQELQFLMRASSYAKDPNRSGFLFVCLLFNKHSVCECQGTHQDGQILLFLPVPYNFGFPVCTQVYQRSQCIVCRETSPPEVCAVFNTLCLNYNGPK